jgi:hypothetical protein
MNRGHQTERGGWASPLGGAQDCGGRPLGGRGQQIYSGMNRGHQKEGQLAGRSSGLWGPPAGRQRPTDILRYEQSPREGERREGQPAGRQRPTDTVYSGMKRGHQKERGGRASPLGGAQDCGGHKLGQPILM